MKKQDVRIGMKVVPTKKSIYYGCSITVLDAKKAKSNLEDSPCWRDAIRLGKPYMYVKERDSEDGVEYFHLGTERGKRGGADFFLPSDFHPYVGK